MTNFKDFWLNKPSERDIMNFWRFAKLNENNFHNLSKDDIEKHMGNMLNNAYNYETRSKFVQKYSWSIPCKEAIDAILKHTKGPLYDILGGTGFWAKTIKNAGRPVVTTDLHIGKSNPYKHFTTHIPIKRKNALRAAYRFQQINKPVNVILSWIPCESTIGESILNLLPSGSTVIMIGEGQGGCCGTHKTFSILYKDYTELYHMYLPQWYGLHDSIEIYIKK